MQKIKNIFLVAWKSRKFLDKNGEPIGSIMLPEQKNEFDGIWEDLKFGDFSEFEVAVEALPDFQGGIIKDESPYKHTIAESREGYFQEEFKLLSTLKEATSLSKSSEASIHSESDLEGYRFYVIESEDDELNETVYHFSKFIPKYHILLNKKILSTKKVTAQEISADKSAFSLESLILIEPIVFASAKFSNNPKEMNIEVFVHKPKDYATAFNLKDSYFEYARKKFKNFSDENSSSYRTISSDNIKVICSDDFNPNEFFKEKNVNIAKKIAKDTEDDKEYPIENIVEANEKLKNADSHKNFFEPLEFLTESEKIIAIKVMEKSVGTLSAIMDGQIWTNEIHKKTQTNI